MRSRMHFLAAAATLLAVYCPVRAESPSLLLEKGLFQERTAGNLDSAIGIYRQILQQEKDDRAVAAHAMYRLGECYAKKGQTALAISTLQQLVRKFPSQADVVEQANTRLVALKAKASPTAPPVVLRTVPKSLANDVDPGLTRITVTFDRPMLDENWSWTGGGERYPKTTGKPSYDPSHRTCSLPVKLEPGKVYWVGINAPGFKSFQSASKVPAAPQAILFATRSADGKPTPIPQEMIDEAKQFSAAATGEAEEATGPAPQIVSTTPKAFDNSVDPALDHMSVTFDQEMMDKNWSWTGGGDTYPESGIPSYDAARKVCSRSVKLQPGKVYWVGINSPSNRNFQSAAGVPAPWYAILFATRSADGKPTPIPEDMLKQAREINAAAESKAKGALREYPVDKGVADFPAQPDLSTPESAAAAFYRGGLNPDSIRKLSWIQPSQDELDRMKREDPAELAKFEETMKTGRVLHVLQQGDLAGVVVKLNFPRGWGRSPFSLRFLTRINGQWKNIGEDRYPSQEAASESFRQKLPVMTKRAEDIRDQKRDVGSAPAASAK
jgi:tetratricopeptide (TPR) repeat protein